MRHQGRRVLLACLCVLTVLLFAGSMPLQAGKIPRFGKKSKSSETPPLAAVPQDLTPEKVDAYLATLSDDQARQVLALTLRQKAAAAVRTAAGGKVGTQGNGLIIIWFRRAEKSLRDAAGQLRVFYATLAQARGSDVGGAWLDKLSGGRGAGHLVLVLFGLVLLIAGGLALERLSCAFTDGLRRQLVRSMPHGFLQKSGHILSGFLLDVLGVAVFILATFIAYVVVFPRAGAEHAVVSGFLLAAYYYRVIMLAARVLLAPKAGRLRLAPMADADAKFLYRWMRTVTAFAAVTAPVASILKETGFQPGVSLMAACATGLGITLLIAAMVWQARGRVAAAICPPALPECAAGASLRARFAGTWHLFAILYVLVIGFFWQISVVHGQVTVVKLIVSLFLIPAFIGLDAWGQRLLKMMSGEMREVIDLSGEEAVLARQERGIAGGTDIKDYVPLIRRILRTVLVVFFFFMVLRLWGIDLSVGRIFTGHVLNVVVTLLLGFIAWQLIKTRIDRRLNEEMPDDDREMEEGGKGGSRSATLLVLLRKFILTVMLVIVSLIVLSSVGIDIGPLIAGAGVVGLAIGFGAQTLVKDIISGVFFLIDDAFRVGDYIRVGSAKGMVEHISLRSLKLRHPRGMVYTIPFGSMGSVQNLSRDYIITKLDFRVRYDTDVDKVRKIIKKINKKLAADPEIAKVLLSKVKSQGIRELDDSAMIMRVKFKTYPGEQFVVRRHVFQMMQQAFRENGIQFAHRDVTVYIPPESRTQPATDGAGGVHEKVAAAAAGGAAAAILADEQARAAKQGKEEK